MLFINLIYGFMIDKVIIIVLVVSINAACSSLDPQAQGTNPITHEKFTALLTQHVDESGLVDYLGFKKDQVFLNEYLDQLSNNPPNDQTWSESDKLAYWINVYNAFTIDLIIRNYPLESIKDIGSNIQIPFVNTPWDIKFIPIGEENFTLNNIEHNILRKIFNEPRIHFAINCASMSCPTLLNEAYEGYKIEQQLSSQTRLFFADKRRNNIETDKIQLSKILKWFGGDFTKDQTKQEFVNKWTHVEVSPNAKIDYLDYDWSLNESKK